VYIIRDLFVFPVAGQCPHPNPKSCHITSHPALKRVTKRGYVEGEKLIEVEERYICEKERSKGVCSGHHPPYISGFGRLNRIKLQLIYEKK
jgi:hypothetical protein